MYSDEGTVELPEAETTEHTFNSCELRVTHQTVEDKLINLNQNKSAVQTNCTPEFLENWQVLLQS